MEGRVRVQMFDAKSKKCVYDSGGKNVITNLYKNIMEDIVKIGLYNPFSEGISNYYSYLTPRMFSNGILLLSSPQVESPDTLYPRGKILGYAGSYYAGSDYSRGTLNTAETGSIVNGYQWVWEWTSERANGLISAVGLCPIQVGNGNLYTPWIYDSGDNQYAIAIAYGYDTQNRVWDSDGSYYRQHNSGYIKGVQRSIGYNENIRDAKAETTYNLGSEWTLCSRPTLYAGKIWLLAYNNSLSLCKLLKITKGTANIEEQWTVPGITNPSGIVFGMTDTHMHYVYYNNGSKIRSFNLSTESFEATEPAASSSYIYQSTSWFSTPTYAVVMGSDSSSTSPGSYDYTYGDIIYPDQTKRGLVRYDGIYAAVMPFGEKPYGLGYNGKYAYRHLSVILPLFSVKNLEAPQTKDATKTMKITYTITW